MTAREIFDVICKQRGIKDPERFALPKYEELGDPLLLPDIEQALKRLKFAIKNKQKVAVYGDYDIDGLTATTLLCEALQHWGLEAETFIPDRFIDGYGLSERGIDELKQKGVELLLTVDTGSLSHEHIAYAKSHGIDTIVTDHHTVGETMPDAVAVINPKRPDSKYPFKDLAGVGVAFTLVRAMQKEIPGGLAPGLEKWLLDLVALGTVCDIVPLVDENRTLVYWGLHVMKKQHRPGLKALMLQADVQPHNLNAQDLGFRLGPRLNASGRLTHAKHSLDLLQTGSAQKALHTAQHLEKQNQERRSLQSRIYKEALAQAEEHKDDDVLVLAGKDWSHGVVGIVAAKIVERLGKPAFVLEIDGDQAKGSARSFGDFHLAPAIAANKKIIEKGGGHSYAAGVTLQSERLADFRKAMNAHYKKLRLKNQAEYLMQRYDIELHELSGISDELIELLQSLEPFGNEHEQPMFRFNNILVADWRAVGADGTHLKLTVQDASGSRLDGIGFGLVEYFRQVDETQPISLVAGVEHNEFRGQRSVQLMVQTVEQAA